jgi:predicted nucleic acid-binding protein
MADYFFDTSVLVAYFKEEDARTIQVVESVLNGDGVGFISAITVAEICAASDMDDLSLRERRLAVLNLLSTITVDHSIAERGGELRRQHNLALPDALIAACAEQAGGHFLTKDPHSVGW